MKQQLIKLKNPSIALGGIFDKENIENKLKELEKISSNENFWKDQNLVKKTVKQKKFFQNILDSYNKSLKDIENVRDLFELASQEKDEETLKDCNQKITKILSDIKKNEINCFISGDNDEVDI